LQCESEVTPQPAGDPAERASREKPRKAKVEANKSQGARRAEAKESQGRRRAKAKQSQ
jgi:hypothetical protein